MLIQHYPKLFEVNDLYPHLTITDIYALDTVQQLQHSAFINGLRLPELTTIKVDEYTLLMITQQQIMILYVERNEH